MLLQCGILPTSARAFHNPLFLPDYILLLLPHLLLLLLNFTHPPDSTSDTLFCGRQVSKMATDDPHFLISTALHNSLILSVIWS